MHPLAGAFEKLGRGEEHINELDDAIAQFSDAEEQRIKDQLDAKLGGSDPFASGIPRLDDVRAGPVPARFGLLVGDAVQNLRAALEYLVHELQFLDSGERKPQTQFPICCTHKAFQTQAERSLNNLSQPHIDAIERLQPYNGEEWLKWLQSLSNPDKHRNPIATDNRGQWAMVQQVDEHAKATFHSPIVRVTVTFSDGPEVIAILRQLHRGVTHTLSEFRPDFV